MNLGKVKQLVKRTREIGVDRIMFDESRLDEIKEALTRQDIRDLVKSKAIIIKGVKGRRKKVKRKTKRRMGKRKKTIRKRKKTYMILVRKLRGTIENLKKAGTITKSEHVDLRKKIKANSFRSRAHLMEGIKK